jgi:VacB/RNase II family 3'-5' exoribonuclease
MEQPIANQHRSLLQDIARQALLEKGLLPDFPAAVLTELNAIIGPATSAIPTTKDLRNLLWCSLDNDDSRDLDQLTVAEALPDDTVKILVAIADVDALVKKQSALDDYARHNTTSIYTAAEIFPMLPNKLSTDLTSLGFAAERLAVVIEMIVDTTGIVQHSDIYTALVRNQAKLAYNSVGAWLENSGPLPPGIATVSGLTENIQLQDKVAQKLKALRHQHGALNFETTETHAIFNNNELQKLELESRNRAKELIEDFMIAANGVTARFLADKKLPALRRVVRIPKRWDRIIELALAQGFTLPQLPDSKALEQFLQSAKLKAPQTFPDLSLSVIKLLGPGEYVVELPGETAPGHFGLAVKDYTHATAPNRRFPDLITQRLLKAAIAKQGFPYAITELEELAKHCTETEDLVKKVVRRVEKSAAALLLRSRIGEHFEAIVTGAADKGTWVRLFNPPVEGRLLSGLQGLDVGQRIHVKLQRVDVTRGFIDFVRD